jgi:hypothetical protein
VPPPKRDGTGGTTTATSALTSGSVINSHKEPPRDGLVDAYIPPKTKNDVPKNFLRPDELPAPPSPEEIDFIDAVDDELEAALEDLEEDGAFLGLAKLKEGKPGGENEDSKKAKYVHRLSVKSLEILML